MVEAPPTTPEPPVDAYPLVEALLNPVYFLKPPPPSGIELVIEGADRKPTTWCFDRQSAAQVAQLVTKHPGLRLVSERPYSPPLAPGDTPR